MQSHSRADFRLMELGLRYCEADFDLAPALIPCVLRTLETLRPGLDRAAIRSLDHCLLSVRRGLGDRLAIQAAISAVTHLVLDTAHLRQHEAADAQEQR